MTVYYLDNSSAAASDKNAGTTADAPFQTLAAINNKAFQPGDTISIKAGTTYQGTLTITADGTADAPITFNSYGTGAKPVITSSGTNDVLLNGANYVVVDGLNAIGASRGGFGIDAASSHNTIQNSEASKSGFGMEVMGQNNSIEHNYVHDLKMITNTPGGDDDAGAIGFGIFGSHNDFGFNTVVNAKAQSYDYGTDGGAFETWSTVSDIRIHDNFAQDNNGFFEAGGNAGDTLDGITIDHNVSVNNEGFGYLHNAGGKFGISVGTFVESYNTIVDGPGGYVMGFGGPVSNGFQFDHNIVDITGQGWTQTFSETVSNRSDNLYNGITAVDPSGKMLTGEKTGDPQFVSGSDFELQAGSAAAGLGAYAGTSSSQPSTGGGAVAVAPAQGLGSSASDTTIATGEVLTGTEGSDIPTKGTSSSQPSTGIGTSTVPPAGVSGSSGSDTTTATGKVLTGTAGDNILTGGTGSDHMNGLGGNDVLTGGAGNDVLTGGAGHDTFVFNSASILINGVDRITDFSAREDIIDLGPQFAGIPRGSLSDTAFVLGTSAHTQDQHIVYDQGTGSLFYDQDGSGAQAQQQFAQLNAGTPLPAGNLFHY